jgi:hypothetical protein
MPDVPRELATCRADFPALARTMNGRPLVFLDGPAGTQVPQAVIDAIAAYYETCNANTHGQFVTSRESDELLEATRSRVAAFLGARSGSEVSFGANMTTLCFALAHALGREINPGDEVVITQLDHEANRGPWLGLAERGVVVREVALGRDGRLDYNDLRSKIGRRTRLLAIGLASNALGTVNDIALAPSCRGRSAPGWYSTQCTTRRTSRSTSRRSTPTSCCAPRTSSTARTSASSTAGPACSRRSAPTGCPRRTRPLPTGSRPAPSTTRRSPASAQRSVSSPPSAPAPTCVLRSRTQ